MLQLNGLILKSSDFTIKGSDVYLNQCGGKPGMLLIHADFCGHCHRFAPTFNEISNSIGRAFCCASIESEQLHEPLSSALKFQGFPTIKFFDQSGKIMGDYTGDRTKAALVKHICQVFHHCIKFH